MPKEKLIVRMLWVYKENVILVTLGDMIKVPGSNGSLQMQEAKGADVRFVYSPMVYKIANENPNKNRFFCNGLKLPLQWVHFRASDKNKI